MRKDKDINGDPGSNSRQDGQDAKMEDQELTKVSVSATPSGEAVWM